MHIVNLREIASFQNVSMRFSVLFKYTARARLEDKQNTKCEDNFANQRQKGTGRGDKKRGSEASRARRRLGGGERRSEEKALGRSANNCWLFVASVHRPSDRISRSESLISLLSISISRDTARISRSVSHPRASGCFHRSLARARRTWCICRGAAALLLLQLLVSLGPIITGLEADAARDCETLSSQSIDRRLIT